MSSFSKVHLIQGPGQHNLFLLEALKKCCHQVTAYGYWPYFNKAFYRDNKEVEKFSLKEPDSISKWIWRIHNKLPFLFQKPWHLDVYYSQYERWLIRNISLGDSTLLWAWSQVSLDVMKEFKKSGKGRIILEYPMIHPVTWNETIAQEAQKFYSSSAKKFYSFFTDRMIGKMEEEIALADVVVVLSEFAKQSFIERGVPAQKLAKVLLPINFPVKCKKYSSKEKTIFLYVGRIELWKGVQYLIEAFNGIKENQTELWLVGTVLPEMKGFIGKLDNPNIKVLGFKTKDQLADIYAQADVMVFPSLQDSFGMVLLEAMSYGLPVIASTHSAAPDIIQHGTEGFIYEPFKTEDLKMFMLRFIENKELTEQMGQKAQALVESSFSKEQYFDRVGEFIKGFE